MWRHSGATMRCHHHSPAQVTKNITGLTFADVFSAVGKKTDIIARFSIFTRPQGMPDWTRDPRGFALKFYTEQGNWDLIGSNFQCVLFSPPVQ